MQLRFLSFAILVTALFVGGSTAQVDPDRSKAEEIPKSLQEKILKMQIEEQKKEFDELLKRSELVAKLSEEIQTSYQENKKLTSVDKKKLKEVDDLLKKIRRELRASKDTNDDEEEEPNSIVFAIENLKEYTSKLFKEVKKTTRHSISAVAIQSSNTVLKLVKFLRFGEN